MIEVGDLGLDADSESPDFAGLRMVAGLDADVVERLARKVHGMGDANRAGLMNYLRAELERERIRKLYAHPAEMAAACDPNYRITPAIELISKSVEQVINHPQRNLLVTMPPQEGKSSLCAIWTPIRALQLDPNRRVIVTAYGDSLAEDHSRAAIDILERFGSGAVDSLTGNPLDDKIGIGLARSSNAVSKWRVKGASGGMVAVGLGSSITGRRADLLIIDDPYKNMQEADSESYRARVDSWLRSVAYTRLSSKASIIVIQTRWHPKDLAGQILLDEGALPLAERSWRHLNIPAMSGNGVKDALRREEPGVPMESAQGRGTDWFAKQRKKVGERVWFAMYEGVPAPPEGGLFERTWFERTRIHGAMPPHPVTTAIGLDPAESGKNDEVGIVAASLYGDGSTVFHADRSGHMTSDKWSRVAVELTLELGARTLVYEAYSAATTYKNVLTDAYKAIHTEAKALHRVGTPLTVAQRKALTSPEVPFLINPWTGKGDAMTRSVALRQGFAEGKVRLHGASMDTFEDQAIKWLPGQHQPDRIAAAVIAHSHLTRNANATMGLASPVQSARRPGSTQAGAWYARKMA